MSGEKGEKSLDAGRFSLFFKNKNDLTIEDSWRTRACNNRKWKKGASDRTETCTYEGNKSSYTLTAVMDKVRFKVQMYQAQLALPADLDLLVKVTGVIKIYYKNEQQYSSNV